MKKYSLITKSAVAAAGVAATAGAVAVAIAPGKASAGAKAPFYGRYFAHRGLHTGDGVAPENSLTAFRMAAKEGYGVELDVHITKDDQIVVFHDDDLLRMTGKEGKIEDFTYEQLLELRLAGSGEKIPLLTEVLEVIGGVGPIVLELKTTRRRRDLCEQTYALLQTYPGDVCIESFDPLLVRWFRVNAPEYIRGQLACPPWEYGENAKPVLSFLLGNCLLNFLGRPQFIAYKIGPKPVTVRLAEAMGAMRVCWTSHCLKDKEGNDAVIFEHYRPGLYL